MPVTIAPDKERRPVLAAMLNGAKLRCPHCGKGHMFASYLKVAHSCDVCGEELHHHRADDFPPYLSIVIVGHIIVGVMLHLEMSYEIAPWIYVVTMVPAALILPLIMLPSLKGAIVGMQWAHRMHGFDTASRDPALPDYP